MQAYSTRVSGSGPLFWLTCRTALNSAARLRPCPQPRTGGPRREHEWRLHMAARTGAALMFSLVTLAILTTLMAVTMRQMTARRKLLALQQAKLQADWLARSGIEYAIARLLAETKPFTTELDTLIAHYHLSVSVQPVSGQPATFRIVSTASFQPEGLTAIRRVERRLVQIEQRAAGPKLIRASPL